jgi:TonB family protein
VKEHKSDIALIKSYLKGDLSREEMYQLERRAQNDPLLMDMLQGMEKGDEQMHVGNLVDIKEQMRQRLNTPAIHRTRQPFWWMAASLVGVLFFMGYWLLKHEPTPQPTLVEEQNQAKDSQTSIKRDSMPLISMKPVKESKTTAKAPISTHSSAARRKPISSLNQVEEPSHQKATVVDSLVKTNAETALAALAPKQVVEPTPIRGRVVDEHTEEPLAGVTMKTAKLTSVVTDSNGQFTLLNPQRAETLKVSHLGYENRIVTLKDQDSVMIAMQPVSAALNEEVVLGYNRPERKKKVLSKLTSRTPGVRITNDSTIRIPSARLVAEPLIGWKAYDKYLEESTGAIKEGAGRVKIAFWLDKDGKPENIRVIKSLDPQLDKRAIEILRSGPLWKKMDVNREISVDIDFKVVK